MTFFDLKQLIGTYTGLERDALHIHAALFLYFAAAIVLRDRRSIVPWLIVLAVELANEAYDLTHNWPDDPDWAISSAAKDLWNTMLWPTMFLLVGRYVWRERRAPDADPS
jgi:hypothetical protein